MPQDQKGNNMKISQKEIIDSINIAVDFMDYIYHSRQNPDVIGDVTGDLAIIWSDNGTGDPETINEWKNIIMQLPEDTHDYELATLIEWLKFKSRWYKLDIYIIEFENSYSEKDNLYESFVKIKDHYFKV